MKYSDRQRLQKIYDYATQLQTTVKELHITEIIFDDLPVLIGKLEKLKSKNFQDNSITE